MTLPTALTNLIGRKQVENPEPTVIRVPVIDYAHERRRLERRFWSSRRCAIADIQARACTTPATPSTAVLVTFRTPRRPSRTRSRIDSVTSSTSFSKATTSTSSGSRKRGEHESGVLFRDVADGGGGVKNVPNLGSIITDSEPCRHRSSSGSGGWGAPRFRRGTSHQGDQSPVSLQLLEKEISEQAPARVSY